MITSMRKRIESYLQPLRCVLTINETIRSVNVKNEVYVTVYLNDCQRTAFYEGIGLDTKEFDMHVIIETNSTTARIFPAVLDVENPEFKRKLDRIVEINQQLLAIGESDEIPLVKSRLLAAYLMKPVDLGSVDFAEFEPQLV